MSRPPVEPERQQVRHARETICDSVRRLRESGILSGSSGNLSVRVAGDRGLVAVTPSSVPWEQLAAPDVAIVTTTGDVIDAPRAPSVELLLHLRIYEARDDVGAIVHSHSTFAAVLSVLRRALPPVIDEMIVHLGGTIEVAEYAFSGTGELADHAVHALGDRAAVLLANHGDVCVGRTLEEAARVAELVEACARVYVEALGAGVPFELDASAQAEGRRIYESRR